MEFFSDSSLWVSFYLALRHSNCKQIQELLIPMFPSHFLITEETSATSHKQTNGEHFHLLFVGDDPLYRRCIAKLQKHFPLQGVAKNGLARSYGKVRDLRDPFRMGSYMLKQSGNNIHNLPDKTISVMKETSFEKPGINSENEREKIMTYLDEQQLSPPADVTDYINFSVHTLPQEVKLHIIDCYRSNPKFKFLTSFRLKYLTQYFLMYHRPNTFLTSRECLDLFY